MLGSDAHSQYDAHTAIAIPAFAPPLSPWRPPWLPEEGTLEDDPSVAEQLSDVLVAVEVAVRLCVPELREELLLFPSSSSSSSSLSLSSLV